LAVRVDGLCGESGSAGEVVDRGLVGAVDGSESGWDGWFGVASSARPVVQTRVVDAGEEQRGSRSSVGEPVQFSKRATSGSSLRRLGTVFGRRRIFFVERLLGPEVCGDRVQDRCGCCSGAGDGLDLASRPPNVNSSPTCTCSAATMSTHRNSRINRANEPDLGGNGDSPSPDPRRPARADRCRRSAAKRESTGH
jgi:hypothetical protein